MSSSRSLKHRISIALRMLRDEPQGFYIDYPYPESVPPVVPTYSHVEELFASKRKEIVEVVSEFSHYLPDLRQCISDNTIPWANNGQFPHLDMAACYSIIRKIAPKQIIEIGSGTSTFVLSAALDAVGEGELKCIDPEPRRDIQNLNIDFERRLLSVEDVDEARKLSSGDVLFIDSSHLFLPGCDVDIQFNRLFPALPSGVFVHVHDIFLPDGYPPEWHRRHYAEQNALIGWVLSGYFEVYYPGYFAATRLTGELEAVLGDLMPLDPAKSAGSIWLKKR